MNENNLQTQYNNDFLLSAIIVAKGNYAKLMDTLMCFCGQENENYEVVLVYEKNDEVAKTALKNVIQNVFEKINVIEVSNATKGSALNIGVRGAKGTHIAFVNEGDLLLPNWVDVFSCGVHINKVIYGYYLEEKMQNDIKGTGSYELTSVRPYNYFAITKSFDYCISAFAFQKEVFKSVAINEKLNTYPEWEFLAKAANICKVHNVREAALVSRTCKSENQEEINEIQNELSQLCYEFNVEEISEYAEEEIFYNTRINDIINRQNVDFNGLRVGCENLTKAYEQLHAHMLATQEARMQADLAYENLHHVYENAINDFNNVNNEHMEIISRLTEEKNWLLVYKEVMMLKTSKKWEKVQKNKDYKKNMSKWDRLYRAEQLSTQELAELLADMKKYATL